MRYKVLDIAILTIILLGILIIGEVSYYEYTLGNVCSRFSIIPACYIALIYLIILLVCQIIKKLVIVFLFLISFSLVLTGFASVGHYFGGIECHISEIGVPTCYIGLIIFMVIFVLKTIQIRLNKR